MRASRSKLFIVSATALVLGACGGGVSNANIGGSVSGLGPGVSVTLQNNGSDDLTIAGNQSFAFATQISPNNSYNVTVLKQPNGQNCVVGNASGTINSMGDSFGSVTVTCVVTSSVGGTISGLSAGTSVTLENNGALLTVAANGAFAFPGLLPAGTGYNVTVSTQPVGKTCTVITPSGTAVDSVTSLVTVVCF
jgi:hypothetical protein